MRPSHSKVDPAMDSEQIEQRAAAWLAKRDSGAWSENDEQALQTWLDESTAHEVAFIRLEAVWTQALRLKAMGAGIPRGAIPAPEELQSPASAALPPESSPTSEPGSVKISRRALVTLAASVVLACALGVAYLLSRETAYRTSVGAIASVPMDDGSRVTLNTDSELRFAVTNTERRVQLDRGEAFFEVAKDPGRPFVVAAGDKRIIAVGTKFSVRRDGSYVRVLVTEGKVRLEGEVSPARTAGSVSSPETPPRPRPADGTLLTGLADSVLLTAGSVARATDQSVLVQTEAVPAVEEHLSWRSGFLIFRDTSLADAVAEFNRYNTRKIVIEDPALAAMKVNGKFRSTNFEAFVRLIEDAFPLRAERAGDAIVLRHEG